MTKTPKHILKQIEAAKNRSAETLDLSRTRLTDLPAELVELKQLKVLKLADNFLTTLPETIGRLQSLRELDLNHNRLTTMPMAVTRLTNLTVLDLSFNQLATVPEVIASLTNLTKLSLTNNKLKVVSPTVSHLQNLTTLELSFNRLTTLPEVIARLQNLMELDLNHNEFTTFPEIVTRLTNLTVLDLSFNKLTAIPETVTHLQNLTELSLKGNHFTTLPKGVTRLANLTTLDLSLNQLTNVPETIVHLTNLTTLNLSGTQLNAMPEAISRLPNLTMLNLGVNQLTDVPEIITRLQNLTELDLNNNQLTTVPETITRLQNLTRLDLKYNQLTVVPETIGQLQKLTRFDLSGNQLTVVPETIGQLQNLKELGLQDNPLEIPPPEVVARGVEAIKNYLQQLEATGQDYLYEAKLLIIGEPGAGKTSLARKIKDENYVLRNEDTTRGIEIISWEFPLPENLIKDSSSSSNSKDFSGKTFRVNIWDFGGQEIYLYTHRFFLTKRSLYVLVADTRSEDTPFYYWLNIVELLSDNSPLLIIQNEKQNRRHNYNERVLRVQFTNLEQTLATNLADNRGLSEIRQAIKYYIMRLPHIGTPLPKTWAKIREALENDSRNYISDQEYLDVCRQNGFTQPEDALQLSGYLHDLGVCLHYQDDLLLKRTVILKPEWGTAAVYKVLDNERVQDSVGSFNKADLESIWHEEQYRGVQAELLQLMMKFKLCYQIPQSQDTYIAPQLLADNQPDYEWNETDLQRRYEYQFMPKGMLTQFIVAMHRFIEDQKQVWKSGVILKKDGAKAEVIEYFDKKMIAVRVRGKNANGLLEDVEKALDEIHQSYRRLKWDKLIPCNCSKCATNPEPFFYQADNLDRAIKALQSRIQCYSSYQMVEILPLLGNKDRRESSELNYDRKRIRALLTEGFSESELRRFCKEEQEFRGLNEELAQVSGLSSITDELLDYAERRELLDTLLDWARTKNPAKYKRIFVL